MVKSLQCKKSMSFEECEMMILRENVAMQQKEVMKQQANNFTIKSMIQIVEQFLRNKKRICYGGVSINALLPKEDQIYNYDLEIPDFDFFSPDALTDIKELADIFANQGFTEVEAKAGIHFKTYKLYVNFVSIADITHLHEQIYVKLKPESVKINGILYCPPNFLRMLMYLELSRPDGNITRWEKVLKRLTLINKHYPLEANEPCFESTTATAKTSLLPSIPCPKNIYLLTQRYLIKKEVVFFGSFALSKYSKYIKEPQRKNVTNALPNFDVLAINAEDVANGLHEILQKHVSCKCQKQMSLGEIISVHYQIIINKDLVIATIYEPLACHSYNKLRTAKGIYIKIATIDTMISFYLAFLYTNRKYYDKNRILCMAKYLFDIQQKNRLKQTGILKRFSLDCYGKQETLIDIRNNKSKKYKQLRGKKTTLEYQEWFLRYRPKTKKRNKS